jgi:uncharacterized protein (TIGR02001 family)
MHVTKTVGLGLTAAGMLLWGLTSAAFADGEYGGAPAATADDGRKFGYTWTVTGASDYMFRGLSFTENDPTVNSYLEFTYGIAYLGFWTSNIDSADTYGPWEQDIYLGIRPVTGPVSWDLGVLYYAYGSKGEFSYSDLDYFEFQIAASFSPFKNMTLGAKAYWTPDQGISTPTTYTGELNAAYALPQVGIFSPSITGLFGYSEADEGSGWFLGEDDYTYWNAGLKLAVEKFTFDFRYWDTSIDNGLSDERFVFSAAVTLP